MYRQRSAIAFLPLSSGAGEAIRPPVVGLLAVRVALLFAGRPRRCGSGLSLGTLRGSGGIPLGALRRVVLAQAIPRAIRAVL
jgi:hypothetical protein